MNLQKYMVCFAIFIYCIETYFSCLADTYTGSEASQAETEIENQKNRLIANLYANNPNIDKNEIEVINNNYIDKMIDEFEEKYSHLDNICMISEFGEYDDSEEEDDED